MLEHMKRTTLILDPGLYAALRRRAAAEGRTLTDVVERTLRAGLSRPTGRRARITLPSYDLGPFLVDPAEAGASPATRGTKDELPEDR
jgi:plasmid stability protein